MRIARRVLFCAALLLILEHCAIGQTSGTVTYTYDELGRLVGVVAPSGDSATYRYDAVGNLLSITRQGPSQPFIASFTPRSGPAGTIVTISGGGFSSTASQNTVLFNNVGAVVTSSTSGQIVAAVPALATTGPITVTTSAGSVTSSDSFVVTAALGAPTITSFTPPIGVPDTAVTVTGTNFDVNPSRDTVKFNTTVSTAYSSTGTTITTSVPMAASSGRISVQTAVGQAVSSGDFFLVPPPYAVSSVGATGRLTVATSTTISLSAANQIAILVFDGTQGQNVSLLINSSMSSSTVTLYRPDGAVLGSPTSVGVNASIITLPVLPSTGTYSVLVAPQSGATGSLTLMVALPPTTADFSLFAWPNFPQNNTAGSTYSAYVTGGTGFSGAVALSVSGLPAGAAATFTPTSVTTTGTSLLNITTSSSTPAGSYTLTVTGTNGALSHSAAVTLPVNPVPSPWADQDIGNVGVAGQAGYSSGTFTVQGSGSFIFSSVDSFHFVYQPLNGDGVIVARVASMVNVFGSSKAGVMVRETLTAGSANVLMALEGASAWQDFQYRASTGSSTTYTQVTGFSLPYWLRLVRQGNTFSGYASSDGTTWIQVGSTVTVNMATSVYIGLAVSAENNPALTTTTFDNVSVSNTSDFLLTTVPSSQTVGAGGSTSYTVGVTVLNGFSGTVNFNATGLPAGASATFNPTSVSGSGSSTLTVSTAASTPAGSSRLTVAGNSSSLSHSTTVSLTVGGPDFTLSVSPASQTVTVGSSTTYTVSVSDSYGFSGTVNLSVAGVPAGATANFSPAAVTGSAVSTLTVNVGNNTPGRAYTLTIVGSSGALTHSTATTLTVPPPDFTLSASASWLAVPYSGGSSTVTITLTPLNGFSKTVNLSVAGLPAGATATFSPASLTGGGTSALTVRTTGGIPSGSYVLGVTGVSVDTLNGNPTHTISLPLIVDARTGPLPSAWLAQDIGIVGVSGSSGYSAGTFTVQGSGSDIFGATDAFQFLYQPLAGDGTIIARIVSTQNVQTYSKAGVMIREALTVGSTNAYMAVYGPSVGQDFQARAVTGASTSQTLGSSTALPYWIKLVRQGNTFRGYGSVDGATWYQVGATTTVNMANGVDVGLAVSAANNAVVTTATFDSVVLSSVPDFNLTAYPQSRTAPASGATSYYRAYVDGLNGFGGTVTFSVSGLPAGATGSFSSTSVTGTDASILSVNTSGTTPAGTYALTITGTSGTLSHSSTVTMVVNASGAASLPSPWASQDIGAVGRAGSASFSNGTFTVQGSGADINNTADAFQFVYQSLGGDGVIIARVASMQAVFTSSKAGIMIRETLGADSTNVYMSIYGTSAGRDFQSRSAPGATTAQTLGSSVTNPYWVKLLRQGNTFSGYTSSDGTNWVQLGTTVTANMTSSVYVGLAVSAANNSGLTTATFDNLIATGSPDFYLAPAAAVVSATQAGTMYVNALNGFAGTVNLNATGLPPGATASLSPSSVAAPGSSTLAVTPASGTAPGMYPFTVTGVSGALSHSASATLSVSGATFVKTDATTQGSWKSVYGANGYAIANDSTNYPAYAQVTFSGQGSYTWAGSTTDVRALQKAASTTDRITAAWYSPTIFTIDINLTDGASHQVALYCLDWDNNGRTQTIDILDAPSGGVLDSRTLTGFSNGRWLLWNLSGHVTVRVTRTGGANGVVNGLFFDPPAPPDFSISVTPASQSVASGGSTTYSVSVAPIAGFAGTVNFAASGLPTGAAATFNPTSVVGSGSTTMTVTAGASTPGGAFTLTVNGSSGSLSHSTSVTLNVSAATFVKTDTTTQGTWKGVYGADGYSIANDSTSYPTYAQVTFSGQNSYTWGGSTSDVRALQKAASSTDRIAATWYSSSSFTIDVNLTDGASHQVSVYCLDWDNQARAQTINILDAATGSVLDTRSISGFSNGQYLVWNLTGHVTISVTRTAGPNGVVSGLFFR